MAISDLYKKYVVQIDDSSVDQFTQTDYQFDSKRIFISNP